jgi:hypothetical protein
MKRLVAALFGMLGLIVAGSVPAAADPPSQWMVFDYNPSGQALTPRNSPNSMPATSTDGITWTFQFKPGVYTALFTTTDPSLTGDLLGKTLTDSVAVSGDAASFVTQNGGGDCVNNVPAAVRFYFTAPAASGPSVGTPPTGFYTASWWSNPISVQMLSGNQSQTISDVMSPADWSDWNGQPASTQVDAFNEAASQVQSIGLSFGGDCFFETGVTPTPGFTGETFSSTFGE